MGRHILIGILWYPEHYCYFCAVRLCDGGVEAPAWDIARGCWRILTKVRDG